MGIFFLRDNIFLVNYMTKEKKLSTKEKIFEYLERFFNENGYIPTVREICNELNVKSTSTVHKYLKELHETGEIIRLNNKKRAISLKIQQSKQIPLLGDIAAGKPILAEENEREYIDLPANFFACGDLFALTVKGDSMIDAGIFNGDTIIVRKQNTAENGDIVAVLVEENFVTVKRIYVEDGYFRLKPENSLMEDIIVESLVVLGKVVGLMRTI